MRLLLCLLFQLGDKQTKSSWAKSKSTIGLWQQFALLLQLLMCGCICTVFLLAVTNIFLRCTHFKFGSHYGEYVDAASEMTENPG